MMSLDDVCKVIALKQAQQKKDRAVQTAKEYLTTGRDCKNLLQRRKFKHKPLVHI